MLTIVFLVGYWALMTLVPVPGLGAPDIDNPRVATFFTIYGVNAIALYVGSGVLARTLAHLQVDGVPLKELLHGHLFASWLPPYVASLGYAITWVGGWFVVLYLMYRRRLILKV